MKRAKRKGSKGKAKRGKTAPIGIFLKAPAKRVKVRVGASIAPRDVTTGFNSHSGEVMGFPRVRAVYWGSAYGTTAGLTALAQQLDNFFQSIVPSVYFGLLAEYSVNQPVFEGSTWLPHDPTAPVTITPDSLPSTVGSWLDGGLLPEIPGRTEKNLLYIVFLSPEMTVATIPPGCAFHSWGFYHKGSGKQNLFVAAVGAGGIAALTSSASHEMAEAFTDRSGNGWFSDDGDHPEIGDTCSCCSCPTLALNGFTLASYWRNAENVCLQQADLTPPPPRLIPNVDVAPFPVPLGKKTVLTLSASSPADGSNVPGLATILQPRVSGGSIQFVPVATVRVPGTSGQLTLTAAVLPGRGGARTVYPFGRFSPTDQINFQDTNFVLTDLGGNGGGR